MEAYVTEEQQIESIKKWLQKYGNGMLWSVAIVLTIVAAARYWFHHKEVVQYDASEHYSSLLIAYEQNDESTIQNQAAILQSQFKSSPYATLASFFVAHAQVEKNEFEQAKESLQWIISHSPQQEFAALARVRLMRILYAQDQLEEALKLFNEGKAGGYLTLMAEVKGDILMKKNDIQGAKQAYELAFLSAPEQGMHGPLLTMKLENTGVNPALLSDKEMKAKE